MGVELQNNYSAWINVEEKFPENLLEDYRHKFSCFDHQKRGTLPLEDVATMLQDSGHSVSVEYLSQILREIIGESGQSGPLNMVDFGNFVAIMAVLASNCISEYEMNLVFQQFDANGDGFITADELRVMLSRLGDDISEQEITDMMRAADVDGDGRVSYQEFIQIMTAPVNNSESFNTKEQNSKFADTSMKHKKTHEDGFALEMPSLEEEVFETTITEFVTRVEKHPQKPYRKSWLSGFMSRRKSSKSETSLQTRFSCPELVGAVAIETAGQKRKLSRKKSVRKFVFSSLRRKPKRHSE